MEESNLFFDGAREIDEGRIEGFDVSAGKVFKEAAESDEMVGLGEGGKVFVFGGGFVAVELEAESPEEFGGDVRGEDSIFFKDFGR